MTRRSLAVVFAILIFTSSAFAKDVYLSITGTVGNFRTDARIFNPSGTKDITIVASFLPVGNVNNNGVSSTTITIPKRQMRRRGFMRRLRPARSGSSYPVSRRVRR
jgi:hypothetical protein